MITTQLTLLDSCNPTLSYKCVIPTTPLFFKKFPFLASKYTLAGNRRNLKCSEINNYLLPQFFLVTKYILPFSSFCNTLWRHITSNILKYSAVLENKTYSQHWNLNTFNFPSHYTLDRARRPVDQRWHFFKFFHIGLGYKMYKKFNSLFIWVGLTHYSIIPLPSRIIVLTKKRRIYLGSKNLLLLKKFIACIRAIRPIDICKAKGILEVKNYKGLLKMKSGKKKQY